MSNSHKPQNRPGGEIPRQEEGGQPVLRVKMLGEFAIQYGAAVIRDAESRSYKTWLLLAYLLCNHERMVSNAELLRMLEMHNEVTVAPVTLRNLIHRARSVLTGLAGSKEEQFILRGTGAYGWNPAFPPRLDTREFESACARMVSEEAADGKIAAARTALELYQAGFLPKYQYEPWVGQRSLSYLNLLVDSVQRAFFALDSAQGQDEEIVRIYQGALRLAPYQEPLAQELMRRLILMREFDQAMKTYEELSAYLRSELDVKPDADSESLYWEAQRQSGREGALSLDEIKAKLRDGLQVSGPLLCELDELKMYYHIEQRNIARRGDSIHLAVLSLSGKGGKALPDRSLRYAMEKLRSVLISCLRTSDIAAQCSSSQYVVMLIQANFESSQMVCDRISAAFAKACPWTAALLQATVSPIESARPEKPPE